MSVKENKELVHRYFLTEPEPSPDVIREIQQAKNPIIAAFEKFYRTIAERTICPGFHPAYGRAWKEIENNRNKGKPGLNRPASQTLHSGLTKWWPKGMSVVVKGSMRGTNLGPYNGKPATGKKVDLGYMIIYRIAGGKFVEAWGYMDTLV